MVRFSPILSAGLVAVLPLVQAQCPNEVAIYNPALRTQANNDTYFIVPVNKTAVQSALDTSYGAGNVLLADIPSSDASLFPAGFDSDLHPVLTSIGYTDDTRMSAFQIDGALLSANVYVPYARRPNSKAGTVLSAELTSYLAGPDGQTIPALVPSLVSTLVEGFAVRLGRFQPNNAAYQLNGGGVLSSSAAWTVVPNPLTGPGVYIEAVDMQFEPTNQLTKTTPKLFKAMLNQPAILSGLYLASNTCQRNQIYYNNATSTMLPRFGNVTFGAAADGELQTTGALQSASPDGSGFYAGLEGFSACGQNVGFNPEDCDEAVQNVDPASL
nr:hypothetical protein CFP56_31025 [Quercus suber]